MYTTKRSVLVAVALILLMAGLYALYLVRHGTLRAPEGIYGTGSTTPLDSISTSDTDEVGSESVTFVSSDGASLTIAFTDEDALLNGLGYTNTELPHAIAASGARYENSDGLEIWNKGNEVTVSKNGTVLFTGIATDTEEGVPELIGSTWRLQNIIKEGGTMIVPQKVDVFTLTLGTGGRVSGTTDCNSFSGNYTLKNGMLTFDAFIQTRMFCEGGDEQEFVSALGSGSLAVSFADTDTLLLRMPKNAGSLTFVREKE